MMKKFAYIIVILFLASCGSSKTADISTGSGEIAVSTIAGSKTANPPATVQSVLSAMDKGMYRERELLVKFKSGVSRADTARTHQAAGASVTGKFDALVNMEHIKLPEGMSVRDAIIQYMSDPNVEFAEPNYIREIARTPTDEFFGQQWGLQNTGQFVSGTPGADIDAAGAWNISFSTDVVVAVIDSGIDYNHPDLVGNIWMNMGENCTDGIDNDGNGFIDDCRGWDFTTCEFFDPEDTVEPLTCLTAKAADNDPMDDNGHGTHVAGIIGAVGHNGLGTSGVLWSVRLMALKAGNAQGMITTADIIAAIQYAVANGARVINASFSGEAFSNAEYNAVSAANAAGVLVMAAAGNEGQNLDLTPQYPASFDLPNIIAVAASDQNDRRVSFTNFGLNSVDVAAPGVYVLSTIPGSGIREPFLSLCSRAPIANYDFCDGTSMATPHVAGLAGLLYSYYTNFSYLQIRSTIVRYVDVHPEWIGWVQTGGRINAYRALSSLLAPTNLAVTDVKDSSIRLSWSDNATGEDGYSLERSAGGGPFVRLVLLPPDSNEYIDQNLAASSSYSYRLLAYNNIPAESFYSNVASATTLGAGSGRSSGGGGSCSIGARQDKPASAADFAVMLMPLAFLVFSRLMRRYGRREDS